MRGAFPRIMPDGGRGGRVGMVAAPVMLALLLFHAVVLGWEGYGDSATWDEVGHFAAGLDHCIRSRFDMYRVNPPLVRTIAMLPLALRHRELRRSLSIGYDGPGSRPEFRAGSDLAEVVGASYFRMLALARCMCIPLSLIGGWICCHWAGELWGRRSALLALLLWVASPSVLGYGHLITPDVAAAGLGLAATYALRWWLLRRTLGAAVAAGLVLGLAELTKSTWAALFALWPVMWIAYRGFSPVRMRPRQWLVEGAHMTAIFALAIWVLNLGYLFEGSFQPLGKFQFISESLGGTNRVEVWSGLGVGNRFAGSWLGRVPVPIPQNYLAGIDLVKFEYEKKYWSYLNGDWRRGGWRYYYLYALLIKEPLGTWSLAGLAGGAAILCRKYYAAPVREEMLLLVPTAAVLALVSSQTGFNHHVRYVLPALPFIFAAISRLGRSFELGHRVLALAVAAILGWSILSSLRVVPHSLSYYNELAGGPMGGHYHLGASNTDWGQDLLYLKRWLGGHAEVKPLHLAYDMSLIDPKLAGVDWMPVPVGPDSRSAAEHLLQELGPQPGWYAVSVNKMHNLERDFDYFQEFKPVGYAGYSIWINHITPDEANRVRRKLGLPPLGGHPP